MNSGQGPVDLMEASMLETPTVQQSWRICVAVSIELQGAHMDGITGNVCNQRLRCSGCEQCPRDAVIKAFESGNMPRLSSPRI